ncbi:hypothetical protein J2Y38_004570 [Flavobacterium sp. 2755]|nr:hypothetical protein [Flavobacterium sp. 2755]MDR6764337.1 hypothetical protein [Flavobacterium sp. 2755]
MKNNLMFAPTIIVNNYVLPKQYTIMELIYFIPKLIEDEYF